MAEYLGEHENRHHIRPKSRFKKGKDYDKDNIANWDKDFHIAWHKCFGNMTIEEIKIFIDVINNSNTNWTREKLHKLRETLKMR